jgi:hypothetical protein
MVTKKQDRKIKECVDSGKWKGKVNKRTNKAYTKQERFAICTTQVTGSDIVEIEDKLYYVSCLHDGFASEDSKCVVVSDTDLQCDDEELLESIIQSSELSQPEANHIRDGVMRLKSAVVADGERVISDPIDLQSFGLSEEEIETIQSASVKANERGNFIFLAGMEGQKGYNNMTGDVATYSAEFFEKNHKAFKGSFYYPEHFNAFNVTARMARVVKSWIEKKGKKNKVLMFHEVSPRNDDVRSDIEGGYLSDVSIDVLSAIMSEENDKLIVDGEPHGTAFVSGPRKRKGCPTCKVINPVGSCDESPSGTPDVPRHEENTEVKDLSEKDEKDTPPADKGVSSSEIEEIKKQNAELTSSVERLEFGNQCADFASALDVGKDVVMTIVSSTTAPEDRMAAFQSLVETVQNKMKEIVESKVVEGEKTTGGEEDDEESNEFSSSDFASLSAELEGSSPPPADGGGE